MATIRYFVKPANTQSKDSSGDKLQYVFFRYRPSRQLDLTLQTPFKILPQYWDAQYQRWSERLIVKGAKSSDAKQLNNLINNFNRELSDFRNNVEGYITTISDENSSRQKVLIKDFVTRTYFANRLKISKSATKKIPDNFTALIDFYIDQRSVLDVTKNVKPLAVNTIKKYRTLQNILKKFDRNLNATDINDVWRNDFVNFLNRSSYSEQTQVKYIKDIKMLCKYANKDNNISKQVLAWEINSNPRNVSEYLTFSFHQLELLRTTKMSSAKLDNVRDWLLISCYTSVRVSELLIMCRDNIIQDGDDYFIEVIEKKNKNSTGGLKFVYLHPIVIEILNKRNGDFPKRISEQRYNEYLKIVCKEAKLSEIIEWGKSEITVNGVRKRLVKGPFHDFVTSHSGRATYVTLFRDKLPFEVIQMQTNHHSIEMVEHYDKTDERIKKLQRAKTVAQAHRGLEDFVELKLKIV